MKNTSINNVTPDDVPHSGDANESNNSAAASLCSRNYFALWWLGMINNLVYCVVISAADDIATSFGCQRYVGLLSWANVAFGTVVRFLNVYYHDVPVPRRVIIVSVMGAVGVVMVSVARYVGSTGSVHFVFAMIGVMIIGSGNSYGESVLLGYLEHYPPHMVGGWSSGTGMSGVAGALIYLSFANAGLDFEISFIIMLVFIAIYVFMFFGVLQKPANVGIATQPSDAGAVVAATVAGDDDDVRRALAHEASDDDDDDDATGGNANDETNERTALQDAAGPPPSRPRSHSMDPTALSWPRIKHVHSLVFFNSLNLLLVYAFEYACQFAVPFTLPCWTRKSDNFVVRNMYVLCQLSYQVGVLFSRSSLQCFRINRVGVLTVLQGVNALFWLLQAKYMFIHGDSDPDDVSHAYDNASSNSAGPVWVLLVLMWYCGLLGGAGYVNVFYRILNDDRIEERDRNLAINVGAIYVNVGIITGSLMDVVYAVTILTRSECPKI
eukprot:PhM_4_TR1396/c0_g1_i1/m.87634/K12389/BTS, CLN3; battenin